MLIPRDPQGEATRLAALHELNILDSPREETFDRIVSITSALFDSAMAAITLVDRDRSWHKAEVGMGVSELPREDEMCDRTIHRGGVYVIPDANEATPDDAGPMFKFGIRFYIGAPLRTRAGVMIGTLCAMDPLPKEVTARQMQTLRDLAEVVIDELELRQAARRIAAADQELRSLNQQLEASNRNTSDFIAGMAHELRTPLNGILGASELLSDGTLGPLNTRQREYVVDISGSGAHLLRLIEDLLDISKIEAGQLQLRHDLVEAEVLMVAAAALVRTQASTSGVTVELFPPPKRLVVNVDERRLTQVACNLLSNAIRFSPPAGVVRFTAAGEADRVIFTVSDEGPGVPQALRDRIFEKFFRADPEHEGAGLGLTLARNLVELHGGTLWLSSKPGKGSAFSFSLPLATGG